LSAARALRRARARLTLIDQSNHHLFQPLLYQVATAALNPSDIASPIRRILRGQENLEVLLGLVKGIDPADKRIDLIDGSLHYDFLILATGATHSYFGHDEWEATAPGLKSLKDALEIRRRVLLAFEAAEREPDRAIRRTWLTFVIIGAGPTGVELAGTLAEVARQTLASDFAHIDTAEARILLIEGGPRPLPAFTDDLSEKTLHQLEYLGVEVRTGALVTGIDGEGVSIGSERIEARTVIWAAGVAASPLGRSLGVPLDRAGRVIVGPDLTIPGYDHVYVVGDLAHVEIPGGGLVPGVAPAAMQMGQYAASSILRRLDGRQLRPFRYKDKGMLATIGRGAAVAHVGPIKVSGYLAWLLWLFVHIFFLIGFRNRLVVMFQWAWSYFTFDRGARLIIEPVDRPISEGPTVWADREARASD